MSRARRQRDSTAPSLFPFLAVLLCTMGALVLILMLIVSGAQASALKIAEQSEQQVEEVESQLQLAVRGFQKQLEEGRLALEKKRLALQHLENHIQELLAEMKQLERTAELALSDASSTEESRRLEAEAISKLQQQLLEAELDLKQKLEKPDGDKPIFAIIPYGGPNGTHRRPIYLECLENGVIIQPEGIRLNLVDLEPPYGPGNPLDAALRTIRSQFVPENLAVTSTAYPLLIVRPSGIRTYAMARAAMSGWDDQFGYELVGEDLELTYPQSEPGLSDKITQALELARQRQAALIMAMPQKYRQFSDRDQSLPGGNGGGGNYAASGSGYSSGSESSFGQRGGWAANSSSQAGGGGASNSSDSLGFGGAASAEPLDFESAQAHANGRGDSTQLGNSYLGNGSLGAEGGSYFAGAESGMGSQEFAAGDSATLGPATNSNTDSSRNIGAQNSSSANSSDKSGGGSGGTGGTSSAGQPLQNSGGQTTMSMAAGGQSGGSQRGSPSSGSQPGSAGQSSGGQNSSMAPSQGGAPQISADFSPNMRSAPETSTPVATRRGRGWAWSQGPSSQTPVARSIHLQCYDDRWVILPDSGKANAQSVTIPFDGSPQQRAEKLADVVADRVDGWGLALTGGYWKPTLVVDVAPDAAWRYYQLEQLLDGSGLDLQRNQPIK